MSGCKRSAVGENHDLTQDLDQLHKSSCFGPSRMQLLLPFWQ